MESNVLPPEPQNGNVEYKLRIASPSKKRFEHLVTQMKWRLNEGKGEAIYKIGVEDSGLLTGLTSSDMAVSLQTLDQIASKLGATTIVLIERCLENHRIVAEVLVKSALNRSYVETTVAVLGSTNAGKSTLVGVLTYGRVDNGRGGARLNMFRHLHEIRSGRTSSISHEILGFNTKGQDISYSSFMTAEGICENSSKLISFLDLAGHRKYIRTTIQGLSGYLPHYAILTVSSSAGMTGMTREHLRIATALKIPFFVVITKIDLVSPQETIKAIESLFKELNCNKILLKSDSADDAITNANIFKDDVVPLFCVSNVTGEGLKLLLKFLFVLPPGISVKERERLERERPEFQIDENFRVGDDDQILGGLLTKGVITEGIQMKIGPHKDGSFTKVTVRSIHRNKVPCRIVRPGESATLCMNEYVSGLRNGMVLVDLDEEVSGIVYFEAVVSLLYMSTSICSGFQTTLYIENIRQTARIIKLHPLTSEKKENCVLFKFINHPELVRVGQHLFFKEGKTEGVGEVVNIFP